VLNALRELVYSEDKAVVSVRQFSRENKRSPVLARQIIPDKAARERVGLMCDQVADAIGGLNTRDWKLKNKPVRTLMTSYRSEEEGFVEWLGGLARLSATIGQWCEALADAMRPDPGSKPSNEFGLWLSRSSAFERLPILYQSLCPGSNEPHAETPSEPQNLAKSGGSAPGVCKYFTDEQNARIRRYVAEYATKPSDLAALYLAGLYLATGKLSKFNPLAIAAFVREYVPGSNEQIIHNVQSRVSDQRDKIQADLSNKIDKLPMTKRFTAILAYLKGDADEPK